MNRKAKFRQGRLQKRTPNQVSRARRKHDERELNHTRQRIREQLDREEAMVTDVQDNPS